MPFKPWLDGGSTRTGPTKTVYRLPSQTNDISGLNFGDAPSLRASFIEDFTNAVHFEDYYVPVVSAVATIGANSLPAANTNTALATFTVPRDGVITAVGLTTVTGQAANDTNNFTFTMLNKLASGSGSTAILAASPSNTTLATGGTAITANVEYAMALHATAANQRVAAGDVLQFTSTTAGTPTLQNNPMLRIRIAFPSRQMKTIIARTAGSPLVQRVANTAGGEGIAQLSATNEVNDVFYYLGDALQIPATARPIFEARVKVGTVTTAQQVVIGLASAYNTTLDNIVSNAWFRYEASLAALIEGDDGTTDTDDQATGFTATTGTYYHYGIDASDLTNVCFYIDRGYVGSVSVSAWTSSVLLQPFIGIKKASGTGTVSVTIDKVHCVHDAF